MTSRFRISAPFLLVMICATGCRTPPGKEAPLHPPPVGIIRFVNQAERYVVFEAEFSIRPGEKMNILRDGTAIGQLESGTQRRRKFQSADILEGHPKPGDQVEPVLPVKPQPAEQTEGGGFRP
jgi:hypothetical protein